MVSPKKHVSSIPVALNSIYILISLSGKLKYSTPSFFINHIVGFTTASADSLELILDPLHLKYFGIQNVDRISYLFMKITPPREK